MVEGQTAAGLSTVNVVPSQALLSAAIMPLGSSTSVGIAALAPMRTECRIRATASSRVHTEPSAGTCRVAGSSNRYGFSGTGLARRANCAPMRALGRGRKHMLMCGPATIPSERRSAKQILGRFLTFALGHIPYSRADETPIRAYCHLWNFTLCCADPRNRGSNGGGVDACKEEAREEVAGQERWQEVASDTKRRSETGFSLLGRIGE